jgi:hypothetical protein
MRYVHFLFFFHENELQEREKRDQKKLTDV